MSVARIKLVSRDKEQMKKYLEKIKEVSDKQGIKTVGPISLPTKKLKITTRKEVAGEGKASFDRFEMRLHRRLIEISLKNDRILRQVMKIQIPKNVDIQLKLI